MARVFISVGSNIEPVTHVSGALQALSGVFGPLAISTVYETAAVGFVGDNFLNLVVGIETDKKPRSVLEELRIIEARFGRVRGQRKFSARTLDLDLLIYDDCVLNEDGLQLPRDELTRYAFVLAPLAELAGDWRHPVLGLTIAELWGAFPATEPPMREVQIDLPNVPRLKVA